MSKKNSEVAKLKQRKAAQILVEGGGDISVAQALMKAGYSSWSARKAGRITTTKQWKDLIEEFMPDEGLADKHRQLLNQKKQISARITNANAGIDTMDFIEVDDAAVQVKALEMAYKLKGRFIEKVEHSGGIAVQPILGGQSVLRNDSDQEDIKVIEAN